MAIILDLFFNIIGFFLRLSFKLLGLPLINYAGSVWSWIAWCRFKERNRVIGEELRLLFGKRFDEGQIEEIIRKSVDNYCRKQVEYLFFGYLDKDTTETMVQVEGLENLDEALVKGKGVILLLAHFGSFLLPLPFLAYRGYKVNQVTGRDFHSNVLQNRFWRWRKKEADRLPVKFIQVGKFLRPIYRALNNNEVLAIAFDGRDGSTYQPVRFFDRTALISYGPINLALKTGAAVVPTFVVRQDTSRHKLVLGKPFELIKSGVIQTDIFKNTERFANIFADFILKYPCHYGVVLQIMKEAGEKGFAKPFFNSPHKDQDLGG